MGTAKNLGLGLALLMALAGAVPAAAQQPFAIVIAGIGGEESYDQQFRKMGESVAAALKKSGVPADRVVWLAPDRSRRDEVARAFDAAAKVRADDVLLVILIGHGSYDGTEYKMNLPGPDASAGDFKQWLDRVPSRRQVVVNSTSSSGATLVAWARSGRAVLAATKSGQERNATNFMRFFADALSDPAADQDKNGAVSVLEAFRYTTQRVAKFYESAGRLATEHPQLDDNGDGEGARDPSPKTGDGLLASQVALVRWSPQDARLDTPAARQLRERKQSLENDIAALKYAKASMPEKEYSAKLEKLLLELARAQQALEQMTK